MLHDVHVTPLRDRPRSTTITGRFYRVGAPEMRRLRLRVRWSGGGAPCELVAFAVWLVGILALWPSGT